MLASPFAFLRGAPGVMAGMRLLAVWYSRVDRVHGHRPVPSRRRREVADRMARAHARSGDAAAINGYLGTGDRFDRAVADSSEAYADQAEADDAAFVRARGSAPGNGGRGGVTNQRKGDEG